MIRKFTGWHMTAILISFFGVVVAVNFTMAGLAIGTFGGTVVDNSYVASQRFNGWLEAAEVQGELGWSAAVARRADGRVAVRLDGLGAGAVLAGQARHPLGQVPGLDLDFVRQDDGSFLSTGALPAGRWTLRLLADQGSAHWRSEVGL